MRELLITPASNINPNETLKDESEKLLVFFQSADKITVFHLKNGKEEEIPLSRVSLFNEHIVVDDIEYSILEKINHV